VYYHTLCQTPEKRRERDEALLRIYLAASLGHEPDDAEYEQGMQDAKAASLTIMAFILMTRLETRNAGYFQQTRDMLSRMLNQVGRAIEDWKSDSVLTNYILGTWQK